MTRAELERFLKDELRLTEVSPGAWLGRTEIPDLAAGQPFHFQVRFFDDKVVGAAVNLGLRVDKNHEATYEFLLGVNAKTAVGGFAIDDEGRIVATAETPIDTEHGDYLAKDEIGLILASLMKLIRDHYSRILQLINADRSIIKILKSAISGSKHS